MDVQLTNENARDVFAGNVLLHPNKYFYEPILIFHWVIENRDIFAGE